MARWRLIDIVTDVEQLSQVTNKRAEIVRAVQMALDRICSDWDWYWLWEETFFPTVNDHTTGNVDVTNGSATVSGGATSPQFTAAMVGRKFRVSSQNAYYPIKTRVSATEITLGIVGGPDILFQGATATDQGYTIYQDEYRLAPDMDHYKLLRQIENGVALRDLNPNDFDIWLPTPIAISPPNISVPIGAKLDTYTTGTISADVNTRVITGASTPAWTGVQGLGRGSRITQGSQVYTVLSVDSDTQLTVYEVITPAIASGSSYSILLDNPIILLHPIPDAADNIYYRYQRVPFPLVDDEELPDMPDQWHWLLIEGALTWALTIKGDESRVDRHELRFLAGIEKMKRQLGNLSGSRVVTRRSLDTAPFVNRAIYPPQYDVKASRFGI